MKKFITINDCEELFIDQVLFEANYPILFTCLNLKNDTYICVCCQNNEKGKKWLLTKSTPQTIIDMLNDEISIRDVFLLCPEYRYSIISNSNGITIDEQNVSDWSSDSIFLPKENEYMEAEYGEFDEEIAYYKQIKSRCYKDEFSTKIFSQSFKITTQNIDEHESYKFINSLNIASILLGNQTNISHSCYGSDVSLLKEIIISLSKSGEQDIYNVQTQNDDTSRVAA